MDKRDISYFNIDIKDSQTKEFEDKLIKKLRESTNIYDSTVIVINEIKKDKENRCLERVPKLFHE